MERITAKQNQLIKDTKKLMTSSKARRDRREFVLEGVRLCSDVLHSFYKISVLLITPQCIEHNYDIFSKLSERAGRTVEITQEIAEKLSDTPSPQGIFCVCSIPSLNPSVEEGRFIALDNLQDPSNLGAVIRSAEALGIDGVIAYNCCDLYNPKALRASMGSILRMPVTISESLKDDLLLYQSEGFDVYGTVPVDTAEKITDIHFSKSVICVIGNEANGISPEVKQVCQRLITIPMKGRAESLNASVAASITMWEMMR